MRVSLIDYQENAADLLLFTKGTRLAMTPTTLDAVRAMPEDEKLAGLKYMSQTIRSSWEFVSYTFLIEGVSRAFTHQFVRNRQGSYAQQSQRITNMDGFEFVMPARLLETPAEEAITMHCFLTNTLYQTMVERGVATEDARSILPTNIATNIVARYNLRTLVELAESRLGGRTQDEFRNVMDGMVQTVLDVHPWAELFFFANHDRDYFAEIEAFAEEQFGGDLATKGKLLKIIDSMRKEKPE